MTAAEPLDLADYEVSALTKRLTHAELRYYGYEDGDIAAAEAETHLTAGCPWIDAESGWDCEDEYGNSRHPESDEIDVVAGIVMRVLESDVFSALVSEVKRLREQADRDARDARNAADAERIEQHPPKAEPRQGDYLLDGSPEAVALVREAHEAKAAQETARAEREKGWDECYENHASPDPIMYEVPRETWPNPYRSLEQPKAEPETGEQVEAEQWPGIDRSDKALGA